MTRWQSMGIAMVAVIAVALPTMALWPKTPARTAVVETAVGKADKIRVIPIYRKIEERAPVAPAAASSISATMPSSGPAEPAHALFPEKARVATAEPEPPPAAASASRPRRRSVEADLCTRHGLHKVITHGGKSWRCR